jgi:hypothetical protein
MTAMPQIRYARTHDGVSVAYQLVGQGPLDVVYANSFMSHVEVSWDYPRVCRECSSSIHRAGVVIALLTRR